MSPPPRLIERLADARVDSITALGSTGSYAYLTRDQRARVASLAVAHAGDTPVFVRIGALRTRQVLELTEDAQAAGASAVLLATVSYQALTADDVFGLFEDVTRTLSVPLIVYDNPGTTHFTFTDDLHAAIARLPHVASVKIPGVPTDPMAAAARVQKLRSIVPAAAHPRPQRRRPRRGRAHAGRARDHRRRVDLTKNWDNRPTSDYRRIRPAEYARVP